MFLFAAMVYYISAFYTKDTVPVYSSKSLAYSGSSENGTASNEFMLEMASASKSLTALSGISSSSNNNSGVSSDSSSSDDSSSLSLQNSNSSDRKIIYTAYLGMETQDFDAFMDVARRSIFRTAKILENQAFPPFLYACLSLICRLNLQADAKR